MAGVHLKGSESLTVDLTPLTSALPSSSDKGPCRTTISKGLRAPPQFAEVSEWIGFLEELVEACGIEYAREWIRIANAAFLRAHVEKPAAQADMQTLLSSAKR